MKIEIVPFASAVSKKNITRKTVVVIDVLRATSVMITALQNGAKEIIPCETIDEAKQIALGFPSGSYLLCGERNAVKIEGFDLGNSPLEFTRITVENKTIIITTTNGTKALNACMKAKKVLIGSFLNAGAIAKNIQELNELVLVCSGTNGRFSLDDGMCAVMIINVISEEKNVDIDDLGQVLHAMYKNKHGDLYKLLQDAYHLKLLLKKGYKNDVDYCLQTNTTNLIPVFDLKSRMVY